MAVLLEGGCRVSDMSEGVPTIEGTLSIWSQIGRTTGAQAISLRTMQFAPGLSPGIRNGDCDEILYAINSEHGDVRPGEPSDRIAERESTAEIFIDGWPYDLTGDTGVYVRPHQTFVINNPGPDPIVLVSSRCPEPDATSEFIAPSTTPPTGGAAQRPPLVRLVDRKAQPTADRWYRVIVDDKVGSANATQFVGSIPPGRAPDHFHHYEEVLFILKGEGRMWAGESNTPIGAGSCIYLPKGQMHCVENNGPDELRLLGVFYPAGSPSVRYDA